MSMPQNTLPHIVGVDGKVVIPAPGDLVVIGFRGGDASRADQVRQAIQGQFPSEVEFLVLTAIDGLTTQAELIDKAAEVIYTAFLSAAQQAGIDPAQTFQFGGGQYQAIDDVDKTPIRAATMALLSWLNSPDRSALLTPDALVRQQ